MNSSSKKDFAGAYDETELVELSSAEESGGVQASWTTTIAISLALCPTTVCTSRC